MAGYQPLKITGYATGLVQQREEFLLPDDAYPTLVNAFVWRERIRRKSGFKLLGRLRRVLTAQALGNTDGSGNFTGNIRVILSLESTAQIEPGSISISDGTNTFTDNSLGVLTGVPGGTGTINYNSMAITISGGAVAQPLVLAFNYFPGLPVMGLRTRELNNLITEETIAFDQVYAYVNVSGAFQEFISGTTWTGNDSDFFWSTNYWVTPPPDNRKLFWVTNFSGTGGDPIRYTNGSAWIDFAPQINAGDRLHQCLAMLPFRGRMLAFNTLEGATLAGSISYSNRIRWAAIGNPISDVSALFPIGTTSANAWRDDIRGKGGFLDIPTTEDITAVGFVRDNLVIYCERSTWQLRYTGRSIAPFQIEKVNTELGAESTFSAVQFDTSLVGIGDKGIVECDSYKSDRIDIKIPDLVFQFNNVNAGTKRVHGIRDFQQRLAYWTYPSTENNALAVTFPNRVLLYNYENDSWAIFTNSFTTFGTFLTQDGFRWSDFPPPDEGNQWQAQDYPWFNRPTAFPAIVAGNQQGFVEVMGSNIEPKVTNDISLFISAITSDNLNPTVITSPNHNLQNGYVIQINNIIGDYSNLNGLVFGVTIDNVNQFKLWLYDPSTKQFTIPQVDPSGTYLGGGTIIVRDNFNITSKKFNFLDEGQNIQLGFIDLLMNSTSDGEISLNVYLDYNDDSPVNQLSQNLNPTTQQSDTFFNQVVLTSPTNPNGLKGSKNWQRIFCPVRGSFITLEWTLSNSQMVSDAQESDVQMDAQILYIRKAGRQLPVGV